MNIDQIQITSNTLNLEFSPSRPISVLHGNYSDLTLDLIREVIGDCGTIESPDRINDGQFVIHADVEMDMENYSICYIRNSDFIGDRRLAVNFDIQSTEFSLNDTHEYESKLRKCNINDSNIFDLSKISISENLSESDSWLASFEAFIGQLSEEDCRPIIVYDFFDRIDEAIDTAPYLDKLASLGRQVFIAVCADYSVEKLNHPLAQAVFISPFAGLSVGNTYDTDFTVIPCPVCGNKTLDNHWICLHCYWEYDGFPEDHYSSANGATLAEYRRRYLETKKESE